MPAEFVDTNIVIYSLSKDEAKRGIALSILANNPVLSIQVLSETANIMRRKLGHDTDAVGSVINKLNETCGQLQPLSLTLNVQVFLA